ncbi:14140_t:CDS:2 [Acaulospora morrowiae]|uniref:14140_t:CDS:1 n=1 Tax=Acaulospora morrowiae TaxID=94023 RepID=A0A9N8VHE6_9GLOM|nr:14140_t:CDS:2 [Acaulospora morrowiae]
MSFTPILEARLSVVEQSSVAVDEQPQNDPQSEDANASKETILEILPELSADDDDSVVDLLKQHAPVCKANDAVSEVLPEVNSKSSEDREMDKFLNEAHKKSVSDKIRQHNKEKLQAQNSTLYDKSSCDIKTVSQGNDRDNIESSVDIASQISNQQKTILNTSLPAEDLDNSDEIELTKNQNIELDLIRDLRNGMLSREASFTAIAIPDPIETPPEDIGFEKRGKWLLNIEVDGLQLLWSIILDCLLMK